MLEAPNELLVALVQKGGATVLTTMLCVCQTWRVALLAEGDRLWEALARERFPRLRLLLQHTPVMHTYRILYRQQLAAEKSLPPPPLPTVAKLEAYIFALEWRAAGGLTGFWSGEVLDHRAWLPVQWSGSLAALEQMRSDLRTFYAAGASEDESQEDFERRYERWRDSPSWDFMKSFTVSLSVMRRADLATLVLSQPVEEQDIFDSLLTGPHAIEIETQNLDPPPGGAMAYGLVDQRHLEGDFGPREIAHAGLRVNPFIRIGSRDFAESGVTVDAMKLGFSRRHFSADSDPGGMNHDVPVTQKEVLRYLAHIAPWPAAGV